MPKDLPVTLEIGPHGKKVVAVATDWPGLVRGASTAPGALDRLLSYLPRYAPVATLAGLGDEFASDAAARVVET